MDQRRLNILNRIVEYHCIALERSALLRYGISIYSAINRELIPDMIMFSVKYNINDRLKAI